MKNNQSKGIETKKIGYRKQCKSCPVTSIKDCQGVCTWNLGMNDAMLAAVTVFGTQIIDSLY